MSAVVAGYANKEIAEYFKISEDTVKHHLSNIFDKLGVSTRLELALFIPTDLPADEHEPPIRRDSVGIAAWFRPAGRL